MTMQEQETVAVVEAVAAAVTVAVVTAVQVAVELAVAELEARQSPSSPSPESSRPR